MSHSIEVLFPLLRKKILCDPDITVAEACSQAGYPRNLVCGGKGTCKKCLVSVKENGIMTEVLSCQYHISDGMEVFISQEAVQSQILETGNQEDFSFDPQLKVYTVAYDQIKTSLGSYDLETIKKITAANLKFKKIALQQQAVSTFHQKNVKYLHLVTFNEEIIDLVPSDNSINAYGIAFDIGTTSVVGYLYDLTNEVLINQHSTLNQQISFGGDVISRIDYASKSQENLNKIQKSVHSTINEIISNLCSKSAISPEQIYHCVFCGNSTMAQLFLGINPNYLGISPFTAVSKDGVMLEGASTHFPMHPNGKVEFLPLLGGFVGADTTSVLLSLPKDDKPRLMIDLGTNGEIAVGNHQRFYCASTACGPALEGAGIHMGMRGTHGAIEKISFDGSKIHCKVIGDAAPEGFCGSGIIDAIAFLYREKLIYAKGNFIKDNDLDAHPLKERFGIDENNQRYFKIVTAEENPSGKEMIITQKDIRQVQLAKAAIYTGCSLLIKEFGINGCDLEEVVLAGAFGNYIDIQNAQFIGLLPEVEGVPIRSIGNGAGTGVQLYLLSHDEASFCQNIPPVTTHIELATNQDFTNTYMMNTTLGQNDPL
ncbi:ASKHA domain-containing protein [Eubacteriaceae bacterium ES3]|nr:ASKHA domain-containing protein [Eubacteriaceae bacterium ES3]